MKTEGRRESTNIEDLRGEPAPDAHPESFLSAEHFAHDPMAIWYCGIMPVIVGFVAFRLFQIRTKR